MTLAEFEQSPRRLAYKCAAKALDYAAQARILQEAIAQTDGEERAFWLRVQDNERWYARNVRQSDTAKGWAELKEVLTTDKGDAVSFRHAVIRSVLLYSLTQQRDVWADLFPLIRPHLRLIRKTWSYYYNLASLRLRQGRWRSAYANWGRAMTLAEALDPTFQSALWIHMYSHRAIAALACGRLDVAMEYVEWATVAEAKYDRRYVEPYGLHLAQAELALAQQRFQVARAALQEGMARAATSQHMPQPFHLTDYDLAAARIARAEGNRTGFEHFCEQALSRCLKWGLPLSEARVRAVMAGAER